MQTAGRKEAHTSTNRHRLLPIISVKLMECWINSGTESCAMKPWCKANSQIGKTTRLPTAKHPTTLRKSETTDSGVFILYITIIIILLAHKQIRANMSKEQMCRTVRQTSALTTVLKLPYRLLNLLCTHGWWALSLQTHYMETVDDFTFWISPWLSLLV